MNLQEYQKLHGIKRIDFSKVKPSEHEEEYDTDRIVCPYCGYTKKIVIDEIHSILLGKPCKCSECEKWFYIHGKAILETTCTPMEDYVLRYRKQIEKSYKDVDYCARRMTNFPEYKHDIEWENYDKYARPLFENMEINNMDIKTL